MSVQNLYELPEKTLLSEEFFEKLCSGKSFRLERIISTGQITPNEKWYNQDEDEWVILLRGEAEITFEDGTKYRLHPGNYLLIPAHQKHKVTFTSADPAAIWLALYFQR